MTPSSAQLLKDDAGDIARVKNYADRIGAESERMAGIVRSLLAFARQDREGQSPARLVDVVETTLTLVRSAFRKDHVTIEADVSPDLPAVRCRSQQVQQVLLNLLTNARDALNDRWPGAADRKRIRLTASAADGDGGRGTVRLTVEDAGAGIPPEVAPRVFDPFFTTKPRNKGTGLGLSISYGIVVEHGGRLSFDSVPGEGTRFHMELPVWRPGSEQPAGGLDEGG
jgi:signal transduction histidine kinase